MASELPPKGGTPNVLGAAEDAKSSEASVKRFLIQETYWKSDSLSKHSIDFHPYSMN